MDLSKFRSNEEILSDATYIYIYIERERERERENYINSLNLYIIIIIIIIIIICHFFRGKKAMHLREKKVL